MARKSEYKRAKQKYYAYDKTKKRERGFCKRRNKQYLNEICPKSIDVW